MVPTLSLDDDKPLNGDGDLSNLNLNDDRSDMENVPIHPEDIISTPTMEEVNYVL